MDNINLIRKIAWGFMPRAPSTVEFSDLVNEAYLAYRKAEKRHDPEKSEFSTWAWHYISGYLKNYLNSENKETGHTEIQAWHSVHSTKPISETLSGLKNEARQVCFMVLCNPNMYGKLSPAKSRTRIKNILRQRGWKHTKIQNTMQELQKHFREE